MSNFKNSGYNNNRNDRPRKKSGAKMSLIMTGRNKDKYVVNGWKVGRDGLTTYFAFPTKKTKRVKNKQGREYHTYTLEITPPNAQSFVVPCFFEHATAKVIAPSRNFILSAKAPNGGYAGKWLSKTYNR